MASRAQESRQTGRYRVIVFNEQDLSRHGRRFYLLTSACAKDTGLWMWTWRTSGPCPPRMSWVPVVLLLRRARPGRELLLGIAGVRPDRLPRGEREEKARAHLLATADSRRRCDHPVVVPIQDGRGCDGSRTHHHPAQARALSPEVGSKDGPLEPTPRPARRCSSACRPPSRRCRSRSAPKSNRRRSAPSPASQGTDRHRDRRQDPRIARSVPGAGERAGERPTAHRTAREVRRERAHRRA